MMHLLQRNRLLIFSVYLMVGMLLSGVIGALQSASSPLPTQLAARMARVSLEGPSAAHIRPLVNTTWIEQGNRSMQKARTTQADRDYQRAETAYRKAMEIDPTSVAAMSGLAWVHDGRHEFEESSARALL